MNELKNLKVVVASDVSDGRDGIGVEISLAGEVVLEIFRDDAKKSREVTLFKQDVPLTVVEEWMGIFKKEIAWDFIDDDGRIVWRIGYDG